MTAPPTADPTPAVRPDWTAQPLPEGGWTLVWRGQAMRTPDRRVVRVPTRALADLITAPGDGAVAYAQRMTFTAIDRIAGARAETAAMIASFGGTDLLCYLADKPPALVERQRALWGPWLDWARSELGVALDWTQGIIHKPQSPEALARIEALALELDDFRLTGLASAASLFGSAVLALAMDRGALSAEAAFDLSRLDEAYQAEHWGVDAEAAARIAALAQDARDLGRWVAACKAP